MTQLIIVSISLLEAGAHVLVHHRRALATGVVSLVVWAGRHVKRGVCNTGEHTARAIARMQEDHGEEATA